MNLLLKGRLAQNSPKSICELAIKCVGLVLEINQSLHQAKEGIANFIRGAKRDTLRKFAKILPAVLIAFQNNYYFRSLADCLFYMNMGSVFNIYFVLL